MYKSLGLTATRIPINSFGKLFEYHTDVINCPKTPILFGIDKIKEHRWYVNKVSNEFMNRDDPVMKIKADYKKGHLYYKRDPAVIFYSRKELLKIHRRFAHPSPKKLEELLIRASPEYTDKNTRKLLEDIAVHCKSRQHMAPKPFLFHVSLPENIQFNDEVILDLTWVEPRPHRASLHVVDRGSHFSAAKFLTVEGAEDVWNTFITIWVSVYVGFTNVLAHDFGSAFS